MQLILQQGKSDCGIACLAMVLSHYGITITIKELTSYFELRANGVTAKAIADVAKQFDFAVKGYQLEAKLFSVVPLPAIASMRHHFVVVDSISRNFIRVADPLFGWYATTLRSFNRTFSNVALTFQPVAAST